VKGNYPRSKRQYLSGSFLISSTTKNTRLFRFNAYFTQYPSFPNLFSRLVGSPAVSKIYDERKGSKSDRIYKQNWKPREELAFEIGAENVIYMLADTRNHLFYIGEAKNLVKRLSQKYPSIPHWDRFRYDVLPDALESYRVTLERMLIRDFATVLSNKKQIPTLDLSDYELANDKIDK